MESTIRIAQSRVANESEPTIDPQLFSFAFIEPRAVGPDPRALAAYELWYDVWKETLHELDDVSDINSDEFTRQHEVGALFYGNRCIGMTAHRTVDLTLPYATRDSYFHCWPETARKAVTRLGKKVHVGSNLTVAADFRGNVDGYSVKEILLSLALLRFLASDADVCVGTMRNNRGMHNVAYRLGGTCVVEGGSRHGVDVDLIVFPRRAVRLDRLAGPTRALVEDLANHMFEGADQCEPTLLASNR